MQLLVIKYIEMNIHVIVFFLSKIRVSKYLWNLIMLQSLLHIDFACTKFFKKAIRSISVQVSAIRIYAILSIIRSRRVNSMRESCWHTRIMVSICVLYQAIRNICFWILSNERTKLILTKAHSHVCLRLCVFEERLFFSRNLHKTNILIRFK